MLAEDQYEVLWERSRPAGGQQVGMDEGIITVRHKETGITIVLPPTSMRSQHKRKTEALWALEYLVQTVG